MSTAYLKAPAGLSGNVEATVSGNVYTIDSNGYVLVNSGDINALLNAGFTYAVGSSQNVSANGLAAANLRLGSFQNTDGSVLAAAAAAGKFGYSISLATNFNLVGEAAESNTKTDTAILDYVLPATYIAGSNITVTVHSKYTGTGTAGTATLTAAAYRTALNGTQGANLIATAAATITNADAAYTFTITGTTLNPGDRIALSLAIALQETGGVATITAAIDSVGLS